MHTPHKPSDPGRGPFTYEVKTTAEPQTTHDPVQAPKHYQLFNGVQVIDVRDCLLDKIDDNCALTFKQVDYWSRSWEYLSRFMDKNGHEDLRKAKFYLDRLIADIDSETTGNQ